MSSQQLEPIPLPNSDLPQNGASAKRLMPSVCGKPGEKPVFPRSHHALTSSSRSRNPPFSLLPISFGGAKLLLCFK